MQKLFFKPSEFFLRFAIRIGGRPAQVYRPNALFGSTAISEGQPVSHAKAVFQAQRVQRRDSTVGVFRHPIFKEFQTMAEHAQVDVHTLQMDYARQQANAGQQYEEWVQNCDRLRYAVSVAGTSLLQERLAVLERNPPDPATATHVQVEDPGIGNGC